MCRFGTDFDTVVPGGTEGRFLKAVRAKILFFGEEIIKKREHDPQRSTHSR